MPADRSSSNGRSLSLSKAGLSGGAGSALSRPVAWLAVWLGGAAGTGTRYALSAVVPPVGGVPVATLGINVVGSLLLGLLLPALARRGPDVGTRQVLRLLLGTGFLGGFTTYSALAVDTVLLARHGSTGVALGYAAATLLLGGAAAWAAIAFVGRARRRSPEAAG